MSKLAQAMPHVGNNEKCRIFLINKPKTATEKDYSRMNKKQNAPFVIVSEVELKHKKK